MHLSNLGIFFGEKLYQDRQTGLACGSASFAIIFYSYSQHKKKPPLAARAVVFIISFSGLTQLR